MKNVTEQRAPVITIDGPSGSGKGTAAIRLAAALEYHLLDSGAIYRAAALHALNQTTDLDLESAVLASVETMATSFEPAADGVHVLLDGRDVTDELRGERIASAASRIAVMPAVRASLLQCQRDFRQPPGLVADGRDMGTVVFPDARHKFFLTASAEERAARRYKQLNKKDLQVTMESLLQDIKRRDERDSTRQTAPLLPAKDALVVDSTGISIDEVVDTLLRKIRELAS